MVSYLLSTLSFSLLMTNFVPDSQMEGTQDYNSLKHRLPCSLKAYFRLTNPAIFNRSDYFRDHTKTKEVYNDEHIGMKAYYTINNNH